ncbi:MAG: hypothetical protein AAGE43_11840, partial [Pseudomonadota bacterium]
MKGPLFTFFCWTLCFAPLASSETTVAKFLAEPDPAAVAELNAHCMSFDGACWTYVRDHAEETLAALPDNPGYWVS